jgi:hypothetical protein
MIWVTERLVVTSRCTRSRSDARERLAASLIIGRRGRWSAWPSSNHGSDDVRPAG